MDAATHTRHAPISLYRLAYVDPSNPALRGNTARIDDVERTIYVRDDLTDAARRERLDEVCDAIERESPRKTPRLRVGDSIECEDFEMSGKVIAIHRDPDGMRWHDLIAWRGDRGGVWGAHARQCVRITPRKRL